MISNLTRKITKILRNHAIEQTDIDFINEQIVKDIHRSDLISFFLRNWIDFISRKYNITLVEIYELHNNIWNQIIHFKFDHPKIVIALTNKHIKGKINGSW